MLAGAAWAAALALLALRWVRTPLSGPGPMFAVWSVPALALAVVTWNWLRRLQIRQLPVGRGTLVLIVVLWAGAGAIALTGAGAEWVMDGLILRRPVQRITGTVVQWLPGLFGLAVSLAGLTSALEARYRIAHADDEKPLQDV